MFSSTLEDVYTSGGLGMFDLVVIILHDPALKYGMCLLSYTP